MPLHTRPWEDERSSYFYPPLLENLYGGFGERNFLGGAVLSLLRHHDRLVLLSTLLL